ncbi:MAG TPA: hypothetical protein VGV35_16540 [Bryobacteraceae bacterium]|nr:hypothetical protein [Bryobacteraceae bacterium]
MEFTGIQIAISVVVIVGAAGVALLCDFLKAKNEQLREAMVELRVRREQEAMRVAPASPRMDATAARQNPRFARQQEVPVTAAVERVSVRQPVVGRSGAPSAELAAATVVAKVAASQTRREIRFNVRANGHQDDTAASLVRKPAARAQKPAVSNGIVRGEDRAPEITSLSGRRQTTPPPAVESVPKKHEMGSNEALADWLRRRAASRATQPKQPIPTPEPNVAVAEPVAEPTAVAPAAIIEEPAQVNALPEVQIDAFLWQSLVSAKAVPATPVAAAVWQTETATHSTPEQPAAREVQFQLIRGSSSDSDVLLVPAGMHDESDLARLLGINKPFTGLVVSIGISEDDGRVPSNQDLVRSAEIYVGSILGESDFGCRTANDQFLMICAGQQGADAQRRLSNIAERLWDYQLRGMGAFPTLFSWGGVDVVNEPLSEAVASATERMFQTKRSRKTVSMDAVTQHRKAI